MVSLSSKLSRTIPMKRSPSLAASTVKPFANDIWMTYSRVTLSCNINVRRCLVFQWACSGCTRGDGEGCIWGHAPRKGSLGRTAFAGCSLGKYSAWASISGSRLLSYQSCFLQRHHHAVCHQTWFNWLSFNYVISSLWFWAWWGCIKYGMDLLSLMYVYIYIVPLCTL